jgi:hypothetical protein
MDQLQGLTDDGIVHRCQQSLAIPWQARGMAAQHLDE